MAFRRLLCGARCALAGGGASFVSCDAPDKGQPRLFSRQKQMPCPRYSTPLGRRYAGTSAARSKRATMLMSDAEVSATARIINNFVDLDYYDEDEEQEIFERPRGVFSRAPGRHATRARFSVCRLVEDLAAALPNEMINLVHSEYELPHDDMVKFEKRMFDAAFGVFRRASKQAFRAFAGSTGSSRAPTCRFWTRRTSGTSSTACSCCSCGPCTSASPPWAR